MRVIFDSTDDSPDGDEAWQPSLWGGPGAENLLRQRPLFEGGMDRGKPARAEVREDQPELFSDDNAR